MLTHAFSYTPARSVVSTFFFTVSAFFLGLPVVHAQTTPPPAAAVPTWPNPLSINNTPVTDFQTLLVALLGSIQTFIVILALVFIIVGALIYITSAGDESRVTWAKSAILAAMIGLAIAIAAPLFLRELGAILGWTAPAVGTFGTTLTLTEVLGKILSFLLATIGVVAIIALVLGAFLYITSAGEPDRADTGKKLVTYAVIGIVVALAGLVLITQVAKFFV